MRPGSRRGEQERPRPFSEFAERPNLVLLGDPGAGKTHLFKEAVESSGGRYATARAFLVTPAGPSGETLFIDGLDERRAGRGDRDTVDALVQKLFAVRPSKVRISCRAADWLGESDLASLRPYFELNGEPVVLHLERLSADDQRAVLQAQGLSSSHADAFLHEAEERGLGDFLQNPQNLLMLLRAVQSGQWPATRKELFELSTHLMLQEFDPDRARSGVGVYSAAELRPVAGGIFAVRLISDVEAISLADHEGTPEIPSYRSVTFLDLQKAQAALGRRVFVAGPAPESADYAHRTTAEYLGAAWLADRVREGLPFGRVQALMGVDGHPAPELRGLHAWLAVHLPECADRLIETDPYGVLTYSDAAALAPSSCAYLIKALGRLSQTNPWFRSGNWESPPVGALARPDMVEEFCAVLRSPDAGFGVRSVVVDALAMGTPLPALKDDLTRVLVRQASPYAERVHALIALLRIGAVGKESVLLAYRDELGDDDSALRLRAEIIGRLYGNPCGPADIVQLLSDALASQHELGTGSLWGLSNWIPLEDIPAVLDGLDPIERDADLERRNVWEVASQYERILVRAWCSPVDFEPARGLHWIRVRQSFSGLYAGSHTDELRAALRVAPNRLEAITDHFLETLFADDNRWLALNRFREATLLEVTTDALLDKVVTHLAAAVRGSDKELFLYEVALGLTFHATPLHAQTMFAQLFALAEARADLLAVRDRSTSVKLPAGYLGRGPRISNARERQDPDEQRRNFERDAEAIRSGAHLGWLIWAANIYFALCNDVDHAASPSARLVAVLGEANAHTALEGLIATLARPDIPALVDVVALAAEHRRYDWWYAVIAGLSERFRLQPVLDGLSEELLRAALAIDLTNPIPVRRGTSTGWLQHSWKEAVFQHRPDLARDAYVAVARAKLQRGDQLVDGLRELLTQEALAPFRQEITLEFLRDYPNANTFQLDELLRAVLPISAAHAEFLVLASRVLSGAVTVDEPQRDRWLATAYVLSPSQYEAAVKATAQVRPGLVFELRNRTGFSRNMQGNESVPPPLPMLAILARLTGSLYPEVGFPSGGWSGDTNAWDAAEYCRSLINAISAVPSEAATDALTRLAADPQLSSYRPHLLHALANQRERRREAEYDRPDWPQTVKALSNGSPATVADLHALLVAHLEELRKRIASENTDIYKSFWNLDGYARPVDPRPEEACRDTLVTLLRPRLAPLGITVEPEGHMVADKRADISVAMPARKILCELKRDYHAEVWAAAEEQLERYYTHDPDAQGFGIYAVFWFGDKRLFEIPKPPGGLARPVSAAELENMLRAIVPADRANRIAVLVIDVSGPPHP